MPASGDVTPSGLVIRSHEHVASVAGRDLELTSREFEIISALAEHPGWVLSAEQLATEDDEVDYSPESVSVLVSRLRHKLADAGLPDIIETVRGFGYRLRVPSPDDEGASPEEVDAESRLRDAAWRLQEAVLEVEHSGSDEQRGAAADALEDARRAVYRVLAR
jgi:DNA-binding winged helix-turn-helix (wHTH) protein